jgi:hypothetical protein
VSRIAFIRKRYTTASAAVTSWPATVAIAAPATPQWSRKIATGSRMTFRIAPASIDTIAQRGLPSERMTGFIVWPKR